MKDYIKLAEKNQRRAWEIIDELNLTGHWEDNGCRANIIGSLKMGLLMKHLDIDLHVYSPHLEEEKSFKIVAGLAKHPRIREIRCINGLHTDEHCISWHLSYEDIDSRIWQIDIIHIEEGTKYDGFFEKMANRINSLLTAPQRDTILRLKYETPDNEEIHGVEYYQAVIEDNVSDLPVLRRWVMNHRKMNSEYWMP